MPRRAIDVINPLPQILYLLRFLCFMAVVYLALHALVLRMVSKPTSKLLWFFSVVTDPLTRPVRSWLRSNASAQQILLAALLVYGVLWSLLILAGKLLV